MGNWLERVVGRPDREPVAIVPGRALALWPLWTMVGVPLHAANARITSAALVSVAMVFASSLARRPRGLAAAGLVVVCAAADFVVATTRATDVLAHIALVIPVLLYGTICWIGARDTRRMRLARLDVAAALVLVAACAFGIVDLRTPLSVAFAVGVLASIRLNVGSELAVRAPKAERTILELSACTSPIAIGLSCCLLAVGLSAPYGSAESIACVLLAPGSSAVIAAIALALRARRATRASGGRVVHGTLVELDDASLARLTTTPPGSTVTLLSLRRASEPASPYRTSSAPLVEAAMVAGAPEIVAKDLRERALAWLGYAVLPWAAVAVLAAIGILFLLSCVGRWD